MARWRVLARVLPWLSPICGFGFMIDASPRGLHRPIAGPRGLHRPITSSCGLRRQTVAHQRRGFYEIDKAEDFDPFAVLSLEIGALRAYEPAERARVIQRAFRAAAFRCHPDTNTGTPDAEAFARVTRAAEMLRSGARLDTTLARLWREEVREWTVEQLAEHLGEEGLPDDVIGAFVEHAVNGREVVGVPQWEGNDTDNFIYCLRWLGTDDEEQARRTEVVLRELVGAECGSNFIPRESQLRKPRLWWGTEPPESTNG